MEPPTSTVQQQALGPRGSVAPKPSTKRKASAKKLASAASVGSGVDDEERGRKRLKGDASDQDPNNGSTAAGPMRDDNMTPDQKIASSSGLSRNGAENGESLNGNSGEKMDLEEGAEDLAESLSQSRMG